MVNRAKDHHRPELGRNSLLASKMLDDPHSGHGALAGRSAGIGGEPDGGLVIGSGADVSGLCIGLSLGLGTTTATIVPEAGSLAAEGSLKAFVKRLFRSSPAEAVVIRAASKPQVRMGFFMMTLRRG